MANAGKGKGNSPRESQHGALPAGDVPAAGGTTDEFDIADDRRGKNRVQGKDQESVAEGRYRQAGANPEPDDSHLETFKKQDKTYRAEADRRQRQTR